MPVFALVDCNNFYASCEKLFDPALKDKPVVVLSNNDGCVVARSAEVKALGIPMGVPWFKIREQARQHGIVAFSSNYALYADMSNRVVEVLSQYSPHLEVYSIDESFLDLSGFADQALMVFGQSVRQRIWDWLGMPVCVGIAPTKTLAKLANHCAKKQLAGRGGVCDFTTLPPAKLSELLATIDVGEVWGVGRKIAARLDAMGIRSVLDLRDSRPGDGSTRPWPCTRRKRRSANNSATAPVSLTATGVRATCMQPRRRTPRHGRCTSSRSPSSPNSACPANAILFKGASIASRRGLTPPRRASERPEWLERP